MGAILMFIGFLWVASAVFNAVVNGLVRIEKEKEQAKLRNQLNDILGGRRTFQQVVDEDGGLAGTRKPTLDEILAECNKER